MYLVCLTGNKEGQDFDLAMAWVELSGALSAGGALQVDMRAKMPGCGGIHSSERYSKQQS